MLTVIALLLGWNIFFNDPIQSVRAQSQAPDYRAVLIDIWNDEKPAVPFEKRLNDAVGGGEIVAVVPQGQQNQSVYVIFRPE
jgi:hypothetical protein